MHDDDEVSISGRNSDGEAYIDRRAILGPAIHNVVSALGGQEAGEYKLGDEAYGCLKDLKKFWRKDDTDDERTVARIFWEARVLPNDLVPILLVTAGRGLVEDKCAIACADLVTAMTWPIDMAEELKELDEELDKGTDYTQLLQSHLHYKAALLRPGVIQALLGVMLPCLAKDKKTRKERDGQIVNVVLHLFRNLAFIKDQPPDMYSSADQAEYSTLQSKLIEVFSETHVLDLLVTVASNASTDPFLNGWNTLVLETFYLLFRGVKPRTLSVDQAKRPSNTLSRLLEAEDSKKRNIARKASSRHSRFGTTITVKLKAGATSTAPEEEAPPVPSAGSQSYVLHRQQALNKDAGSIFDLTKRKVAKRGNKVDELGREDNLGLEALVIMQALARTFIESCFNPFLASILKDIKSERPKITEKDNLRLLFITKWFLEFFLAIRSQEKGKAKAGETSTATSWDFDLVAEVTERGWIVWVLKRMREAVEEKPKLWTELQAGIECLTQLLLLIDVMSSSEITDPTLNDAAQLLQQQLVYNGEVLDIAVDSLRVYKDGVQSLTYLDSSVHLAYALLRMLEKWSRSRGDGEMYVRKRAKARSKRKGADPGVPEGEIPDDVVEMENDEAERMVHETMFTFDAFEAKFAQEDITHTLITYLSRYSEFTVQDQMKRVVNLLHRQAVKAKAEGLFFKVSTLNLFRSILAQQRVLPREQPYKDLVTLIQYILKKFFKAVSEDSMIIVEAFYPKNRGRWKQYSSWEPETKEKKSRGQAAEDKSPELQVKKGYSWSKQLGIVVGCIVEKGQQALVEWVKEILLLVIALRMRIVEETDGSSSQSNLDDDDAIRDAAAKLRGPSNEALAKFEDYPIPYVSDEQADAATKNAHFKLLLRLIKGQVLDDNADELEWYIPAAILPSDLQSSLNVICQFLEQPLDLDGKKAADLVRKKTRRRRRVAQSDDEDADHNADVDDDEPRAKKAKQKKEKEVYKSAQFIEDSDAEYGDDDEFWAKERALREKNALLGAEGAASAPAMRSTGTKKRKKKDGAGMGRKKRREEATQEDSGGEMSTADAEGDLEARTASVAPTKKRPKPRPTRKSAAAATNPAPDANEATTPASDAIAVDASLRATAASAPEMDQSNSDLDSKGTQQPARKSRGRIVLSDDEDE